MEENRIKARNEGAGSKPIFGIGSDPGSSGIKWPKDPDLKQENHFPQKIKGSDFLLALSFRKAGST
jgi:hypothetical protein